MMGNVLQKLSRRIRSMLTDPVRGLELSLLMLAVLVAGGTLAYIILEDMTPVDALYMTIITITTVGFGEVKPLSATGRIFTSVLILMGVATATSAISNAASIVLGQRLWLSIRERRMEDYITHLEKHYIICGFGRMGQQIVRDLQNRKQSFVVVEIDEELSEDMLEDNIPHIIGDGTQDEVLYEAGIERAAGLVAALNSDADNVLTVLSAREINPKLFIVARAAEPTTENKLRRAGANRVVSPYLIGGHRMAVALLRPAVHDFMNYIFSVGDETDLDIGQATIEADSPLAGRAIAQSDLRRLRNVNILAIQRPNGEIVINPNTQHVIQPGETLIFIGPPQAIYRVEEELDAPDGPPPPEE
ncbi:MAG: potassium channel protein [Anaerolineae bacterium]|nr:potassium channel protein [Anaerolineae bacterium]